MDSTNFAPTPSSSSHSSLDGDESDLPLAKEAAADGNLQSPSEGEGSATGQTREGGKKLVRLLAQSIFACFCSFSGLAVSMALGPAREEYDPEREPTPALEHSHTPAVEEEHEREPDPAYDGRRIDMLLRSGNFEAALRLCRNSSPVAFGSDERPLAYREGLCLEALGRWDEARAAYAKSAQPNPDLPTVMWARAELGKARCALAEGLLPECRNLLEHIVLKSGDPSCHGKRILEECLFLLGCLELQTLAPQSPLDPFDSTSISWPTLDGGLDRYLDWLASEAPPDPPRPQHKPSHPHGATPHQNHADAPQEANAQAPAPKQEPAPHAAAPKQEPAPHDAKPAPAREAPRRQPADAHAHPAPEHKEHAHAAPEPKDHAHAAAPARQEEPAAPRKSAWMAGAVRRAFVCLKEPERPIADQLYSIGAAVEMPVQIDPKLEARLASTAVAVDVYHAPIAAVLTALTHQAGCGWRLANGAIVVGPAARLDEAAQRDMALNVLRRGLFYAPNHPRARAVCISASNLVYQSGRVRKAAIEYRQFLEMEPHSAESVHAAFNLGLIELADGNWPFAQSRFLNAIDRAPEKQWADFGWWWIGRLQLDRGDAAAARKPLQRALAGKSKTVSSAAGLTLPFCALLEDNDDEAKELLRDFRILNRPMHAGLADFYEALFRFRNSPSSMRGERVAEALQRIGDGRVLGASGYYFAGQVYREIGRHDRAAGLYDAAARITLGPVSTRMLFGAAERFDQLDQRTEARNRYVVVSSAEQGELAARAELRLAELALRDRSGDECVRRCQALLGRDGVERSEVLDLMGRGYELLKLYRYAADCFAGKLPGE